MRAASLYGNGGLYRINMRIRYNSQGRWTARAAAALILIVCLTVSVSAAEVCAGGMPFGVRFKTAGVMIAGLGDVETDGGAVCPARDAGLEPRDIIISIAGRQIVEADELAKIISDGGGAPVEVKYSRKGAVGKTTLTPARDKSGVYRAGMWVRDSAAGIGTITFYDPETMRFAGLGHGICDSETGELIPLSSGLVTDVSIIGVERGTAGVPGELKGCFGVRETGTVDKNTKTGVYGTFSVVPAAGERMQTADRDEVTDGAVTIRCTLQNGETRDYAAVISQIDKDSREGKSFVITVTDKALIERTGGIVQGMSGSPVIQNGRLIGAVTHVMINDPTRGYGIFIDEMLRECA